LASEGFAFVIPSGKKTFVGQITKVMAILPQEEDEPPEGNSLFCYKDSGMNACFKFKEECIQTCQTAIKRRAAHVAASNASKDVTSSLFAGFHHTPPSASSRASS
jgi:hypothetical protein